MADNFFTVEIITPDRIFYHGKASMIEFNTVEGEIGVFKDHIPLTTVLAPGVVTITEETQSKKAVVHTGFAEILGDKVTLLAEIAEWPEEIDVERAKRAEERAKERLSRRDQKIDMARAELALKKSLARQDVFV